MSSARSTARADAARWLDATLAGAPVPPLLVVLGLGDGSLLDVLDMRAPKTRVLALEPDAATAKRFRSRDWTAWFNSQRLVYLVDPDYAGADEAWRLFPPTTDPPTVLTHPAIARNPGPSAVRAARVLEKIAFGARANETARQQFAPKYLTNSLRNLPAMVAGHDVRALTDVYRGRPAVIAAAGPSLDAALPELLGIRERAVLISADTALRPLLTSGVRPHLAVGLDPSDLNARHFLGLPPSPDTWLVTESALGAAAHRHFGDRTFWFRVSNHEPWPWYRTFGLDVGLIEVWGSVVTAAFKVAVLAGCDPIVFVGTDLAYTGHRPYARRTTYEFEWARWVAGGTALETLWQAWTTGGASVPASDLHGRPTISSAPLLAFRDWLVAHATRSGHRVINATGAGVFFGGGVVQMPLQEALPGLPASAAPEVFQLVVDGDRRRELRTSAVSALRQMRDDLAKGRESVVSSRWATFSAPNWSPQAALAAADEALEQFQQRSVVKGVPAPPLLAHVLARLPESVARWRLALLGSEPLPPPAEGAGAIGAPLLLIEAARLLREVVDTVRATGPEPTEAAIQGDRARSPVSVAFAWPDDLLRDVLTFEGYLGESAEHAWPADGFFSQSVVPRQSALPVTNSPQGHAAGEGQACAMLAIHWALCARTFDGDRGANLVRALALSLGPVNAVGVEGIDATLRLTLIGDQIELPVTIDIRHLARVETGAVWRGDPSLAAASALTPGVTTLADVQNGAGSASIALRIDDRGVAASREHLRLTPRVLTDGGMPRANIVYSDDRGATCVSSLADHSFVVRRDGSTVPGEHWPAAIVNQLALGNTGIAAWSSGSVRDGLLERSYVMFRATGSDAVSKVELPFRPSWGAWWRGRLYWTCFPSGLGSWAPGGEIATDLADATFFALEADEDALLLSPCVRGEHGGLRRQRVTEAWRWRDGAVDLVPLGEAGAATSHARGSHGWTATAFPEADSVRIDSPDGASFTMRCHCPFKVAWLAEALLVSTLQGELLLFDELVERVAAADRRHA